MDDNLFKCIKLFLLLMVTWLIGYITFCFVILNTNNVKHAILSKKDAIVVLTGSQNRISEGAKLLMSGYGKKLLVSGVGPKVSLNELKALNNKHILPDNIILGNIATSTLTNAREAKLFMQINKFESLILVTSDYHMLRSKLIFTDMLPNIDIFYYPVVSKAFSENDEWINLFKTTFTLKVYIEYNKFIATSLFVIYNKFLKFWDEMIFNIHLLVERYKLQSQ